MFEAVGSTYLIKNTEVSSMGSSADLDDWSLTEQSSALTAYLMEQPAKALKVGGV